VSLHRLTHLKIGVPSLDDAATFYADFGLTPVQGPDAATERRFSTVDGGEQLILVHTPIRRLVEIGIAAQDHDDLYSIQSRLARLDVGARVSGSELATVEPATGVGVKIAVAKPLQQNWQVAEQNYPGDIRRPDVRAPSLYREARVRPRKLGHVVFGSTDYHTSKRFFMDGLGFRMSDEVQDRPISGDDEQAHLVRALVSRRKLLVAGSGLGFAGLAAVTGALPAGAAPTAERSGSVPPPDGSGPLGAPTDGLPARSLLASTAS